MTKQELEKMFDDKFIEQFGDIRCVSPISTIPEIKQFIFETIIPEVISSLRIPNTEWKYNNNYKNLINDYIKSQAKEFYDLDL